MKAYPCNVYKYVVYLLNPFPDHILNCNRNLLCDHRGGSNIVLKI